MKMIGIAQGKLPSSEIALGCMRIAALPLKEAENLVQTALDEGINFFDHADIYASGKSEELFAQAIHMSPAVREKILLQTKCGICQVNGQNLEFNFSKEHILKSVEGSLRRLKTDYVDVLLLHRPDALMEPEEVAEAFDALHSSGKVKYFGVSNEKPMQVELLQQALHQPLVANQLQFSVAHATMVSNGINVNMLNESAVDRDGSILDYSRLKGMTVQAWSPFQYGMFEGVFLDNPKFPALNAKINEVAEKYGVKNTAVATAWILRHPAKIQAIVGTTNASRLKDICEAGKFELTRSEWYEIYRAAGNVLP